MHLRNIALGFLAVLALVVAALVVFHHPTPHQLFTILSGAGMLFGTVTVTYKNVGSGTTPPTAAVMLRHNSVVATIAASQDADASAVITHNMNLSAADIAAGWPTVVFLPISTQGQTSRWFAVSDDPNYIGLVKGNTAGGGAVADQLKVTISRPHTIVR